MTQIKEEVEIPSLEDFTESSLLDQIQTKDKNEEEEETPEEIEAREAEEAEEARLAEEAKEKEAEEEADKLAKEQEDELTEEEKEALAKKETEEGSFWGDVEAITGNSVEVDFGDVEPDSPEGAAIREEALTKKAVEDNLAYLEQTFPEGFKALMHVSNGGKVEDLLSATTIDYNSLVIEETNVEAQKGFMKDYYIDKGFSEAKALRNVEDDEDSEEGLFKNFSAALKEKQDLQETSTKETLEKQEKIKAAQDAQDRKFGETLSSVINTGKVGNFNVPKKDAESFYNHVLNHVQRQENGTYALTVPLTNENFGEQLQQMFFGFKKGDLSKFVETKAATENAKRLKRNMRKEKDGAEGSSEKEKRKFSDKLPTLGAFETE